MLKVLLLRGKKSGNASVEVTCTSTSAHCKIFLHIARSFFLRLLLSTLLSQEVVAQFWSVSGAQTGAGCSLGVCTAWRQFLRVSLQKAVLFLRVGRMQAGLCCSASMPRSCPKHLSVAGGGTAEVIMNYAHLKGFTHVTFHELAFWLAPGASCL